MDKAEFDKFAAAYYAMHKKNIAVSGESPEYFAEYKVKDVARELNADGNPQVANGKILDFGAGIGNSVPYFRHYLPTAELICLDVSRKSLDIGESRFSGQAKFVAFDGDTIPFDDREFNVVFASCVFHHIPHDKHVHLLTELRRVLHPKGRFFLFEHNPLNPLTMHAVHTCPFDENARLIMPWSMKKRVQRAGFNKIYIRFRIFFPHVLRSMRPMESAIRWVPLGAQYYVSAS